nr:hypothetical protein [Vibrio sp.]
MMAKTLGYDELIMVASPKYRFQCDNDMGQKVMLLTHLWRLVSNSVNTHLTPIQSAAIQYKISPTPLGERKRP